jgi:type III restriction enzyme
VPQVTIENPILNGPFTAPTRHFRFDDEGITNDVVEKRRRSAYFVPIARPRKRGAQRSFETEWTDDRVQENSEINRIRERRLARCGWPPSPNTVGRPLGLRGGA